MGRGHWRGVERWNGEVGSKGVNSLLPQPGPCYPGLAAHCGASDWVQMGLHLRQLPRFQVRQSMPESGKIFTHRPIDLPLLLITVSAAIFSEFK